MPQSIELKRNYQPAAHYNMATIVRQAASLTPDGNFGDRIAIGQVLPVVTDKPQTMPAVSIVELEKSTLEQRSPTWESSASAPGNSSAGSTSVASSSFDAMTNLPRELRERLATDFFVATPQLVARERSADGTEKFLLQLVDGRQIESVFIPDTPANTFCISTQVGCAMACSFCLTGKMGLVRNLTAGEIVGQVRVLAETLGLRGKAFNIVLMGMGEPLHNYDETMKALRILNDPRGSRCRCAA